MPMGIQPGGFTTSRCDCCPKDLEAHCSRHACLHMRLSRAALAMLADKRSSVTLVVRIDMILPSAVLHAGVPRVFVERITLKKTAAAKGHRHRKKH
jgi:hypothetical protein